MFLYCCLASVDVKYWLTELCEIAGMIVMSDEDSMSGLQMYFSQNGPNPPAGYGQLFILILSPWVIVGKIFDNVSSICSMEHNVVL